MYHTGFRVYVRLSHGVLTSQTGLAGGLALLILVGAIGTPLWHSCVVVTEVAHPAQVLIGRGCGLARRAIVTCQCNTTW